MKTSFRSFLFGMLAMLLLLVVGALAFVHSGRYDIGADAHHTRPVMALLTTLRERSIDRHAAAVEVPDLSDPQLILKGAGQYAAMCTQCHLTPAMRESEIRPGLYPQPPDLSRVMIDPKAEFWAIKHGIKMSAMPAWGSSHDDATIWSMVAFLQKLPTMSAAEYTDIVARAPPDEDMEMDGADQDHPGHTHPDAGTDHGHGGHEPIAH